MTEKFKVIPTTPNDVDIKIRNTHSKYFKLIDVESNDAVADILDSINDSGMQVHTLINFKQGSITAPQIIRLVQDFKQKHG